MYGTNADISRTELMSVGPWTAALGGALAVIGLTRRSRVGFALAATGAAIAYLGTRPSDTTHDLRAEASVLLNCSPAEAYRYWRDFENLPRFMHHLESVTEFDNGHSRWIARAPLGSSIQWDAEIVEEQENEFLAWRSIGNSDVNVEGTVTLRPEPAGRGTKLSAQIVYRPKSVLVQRGLRKLLTKLPSFAMLQDLRRFKALVETGEVPTTEGQSHGPRSAMAGLLRLADPDQPTRPDSKTRDIFNAKRRIA